MYTVFPAHVSTSRNHTLTAFRAPYQYWKTTSVIPVSYALLFHQSFKKSRDACRLCNFNNKLSNCHLRCGCLAVTYDTSHWRLISLCDHIRPKRRSRFPAAATQRNLPQPSLMNHGQNIYRYPPGSHHQLTSDRSRLGGGHFRVRPHEHRH